jgi:hypothetical protein
MKKQVAICLKTAWLAAAAVIFFMGTSMCVSSDAACVQAGSAMFTLMLLITFPAGVFFVLIAAIFVDPGSVHQPSDFITAWFVMMCGGLLQWFVIVPGLFEKRRFVSLNLGAPATVASRNSKQVLANPATEVIHVPSASSSTMLESRAPAQFKVAQVANNRARTSGKSTRSIASFDRKGRTPLERVIDRL